MSRISILVRPLIRPSGPSFFQARWISDNKRPFQEVEKPIPLADTAEQRAMEALIREKHINPDPPLVKPIEDIAGVVEGKPHPETGEIGGPKGKEPTRYGDWERKGRISDF